MKIQVNRLWLALCLGFSVATSLVVLTGCAGDRPDIGADEYADDRSVRLRVITALNDNPDYKFEGVSVTVSNGVARLDGYVDRFVEKVKAGDIVLQVPGIKDMEDHITLREPNARSSADVTEDESLTASVKGILDSNPDYRYEEVNVATFQGTVQLGGFVDTAAQKTRAGDLARAVPGVKDVFNNITVKSIL